MDDESENEKKTLDFIEAKKSKIELYIQINYTKFIDRFIKCEITFENSG